MRPGPGRGTSEPSHDGRADLGGRAGNEKGNPSGEQHAALGDHEGPEGTLSGVDKRQLSRGKEVSLPSLTLTLARRPRSGAWRVSRGAEPIGGASADRPRGERGGRV